MSSVEPGVSSEGEPLPQKIRCGAKTITRSCGDILFFTEKKLSIHIAQLILPFSYKRESFAFVRLTRCFIFKFFLCSTPPFAGGGGWTQKKMVCVWSDPGSRRQAGRTISSAATMMLQYVRPSCTRSSPAARLTMSRSDSGSKTRSNVFPPKRTSLCYSLRTGGR